MAVKSEKLFIQNRHGLKMAVLVEHSDNAKGLAFVMHGLGGWKEEAHIIEMARAMVDAHLITVRFDTTNSFGESDGDYQYATVTNYYEDLEDVITWSQGQSFYREPFLLAGHSLGGMCITLYAQKYPERVRGIAPISAVVSGALSLQSPQYQGNTILEEWEKTGVRQTESESVPGRVRRLQWSHVADRLHYDLTRQAEKLTMPVLLVVGEVDQSTPPEHQQILYDALNTEKQLIVIPDADHNFRKPGQTLLLKSALGEWLRRFDA